MEAAVRRRVRVVAAAGALATAAVLSSCAAGQDAQTANEKPTLDGTSVNVGRMAIRGLTIAAPTGKTFYAPGSSAAVRMVIVNNSARADRLTSISGPAIGDWSSYGSRDAAAQVQAAGAGAGTAGQPAASRTVTIRPGLSVSYGTPSSNMSLLIMKFTKRVYPGSDIPLTFTFANAGSRTAEVPVALSHEPNDSVVPGPSATGQEG